MRCRGPCLAVPHQVRQLPGFPYAARRPPESGTRARLRFPYSSHVPELPPGQCPFLTVKTFLLLRHRLAQDLRRIFSEFFPCPHPVHRAWLVIRIQSRFSTALCTGHPQVTRRNSQNTRFLAHLARRISRVSKPFPLAFEHVIAQIYLAKLDMHYE